jgi:glycosyltransferase involved in cell wall biosynthesis
MHRWHIITGEYPPLPGGVSDYTHLLARGLAGVGDEVHVWAPAAAGAAPRDTGVAVHALPGHFGWRAVARLRRELKRERRPYRLLVQYVPHMYGWKAMNLLFCGWLASCRNPAPWVMFHEVAFPCSWRQRAVYNVLGLVNRVMAAVVARSATRIFVSIPAWANLLARLGRVGDRIAWLPVPSNLPTAITPEASRAVRSRLGIDAGAVVVGHFGTFGPPTATPLEEMLPPLLRRDPRRIALLIGRGGDSFAGPFAARHAALHGQVRSTGQLSADEAAAHLAACDLLVQPYPDGASTRRGTLMAGLALGRPIVTTHGALTEPFWRDSGAVALAPAGNLCDCVDLAERLLSDHAAREALGGRAAALYAGRFALDQLIATLRQEAPPARVGAERLAAALV